MTELAPDPDDRRIVEQCFGGMLLCGAVLFKVTGADIRAHGGAIDQIRHGVYCLAGGIGIAAMMVIVVSGLFSEGDPPPSPDETN